MTDASETVMECPNCAVLRDNIMQLRTALDAVPLQAIFRFIYGTQYDTPNDSDADRTVIDAWLRKELCAE